MITITGSLAFDHIMNFDGKFGDHIMPDKIHQISLSFLVNNLQKQKGGTAGNIAYNLALLNTPSSILGCVGSDFADYKKFLEDVGVDVSNIKTVAYLTSSAFIMTDQIDNQITGFYPGAMSENANLEITPTDLVVIAPNDPQAMIKYASQCQSSNIPYMLDPGMQLPVLSSDDLKSMITGATILIGNDYEISLLKRKTGFSEADLLNQVKILITTLGEKGSIIQTAEHSTSEESKPAPWEVFLSGRWDIKAAKPESVSDPTGAGDAYRAGFLAGYTKNLDLKTCGQMGSVASCYAIEKYGTTNHKFTLEQFKDRYKENFGEELTLSP